MDKKKGSQFTVPKHFKLLKSTEITELKSHFYLLKHEVSGARLMHIYNHEPENVFCISFPTYPSNSTGAPHILEHMVLCGSKKYDVKDPFFSMTRRSLNTFMNAFTGSDFTCYPAASQNRTDFYNLLDVYIDASFFPNLDDRSFMQEGHRLEWQNPEKLEKLVRAGIVYNEMKGAYISPDTHIWKMIHSHLLEKTCYHFDSGGDPEVIPELTHQDLVHFHKTYYHPSHALFFFYGNIPTHDHANYLHERLLKEVQEAAKPLEKRTLQTRWKKSLFIKASIPSAHVTNEEEDLEVESKNKPTATLSWLTCSLDDAHTNLLLDLLDYLLMGHDGAALKSYLLSEKLCKQVYSSLEHEMLDVPYSLILREVKDIEPAELFEKIYHKIVQIHKKGFEKDALESALHQLKISRLEISGGGYPFGLNLFFRSGLSLQQGADPLDSLKLHEHFEKLSKLTQDQSELLAVMEKYLISNTHRLELWLEPDPQWAERAKEKESKQLQKIENSLTLKEKEKIAALSKELKSAQEKPENRNLLPKIAIKDIGLENCHFPLIESLPASAKCYAHDSFTNGFVYAKLHYYLDPQFANSLKPRQWQELKLLSYLWTKLGAAHRNFEEQLQWLDLHSQGISSSLEIVQELQRPNESSSLASMAFSIGGLEEKSSHFGKLLRDVIFEGRLDEIPRIEQIVRTLYASLQNQIPSQALNYALLESSADFSTFGKTLQWLNGLDYLRFIESEHKSIQEGTSDLAKRLEKLKVELLNSSSLEVVLSANAKACQRVEEDLSYLAPLKGVQKEKSAARFDLPSFPVKIQNSYQINSDVNFVTLSLKGPHLLDEGAMALRVACELIKHQVLHPEIREKGGAYGYGCNFSPEKQTVSFHSYRDPHIARTLEAFKKGVDLAISGQFSEEDIDEAKRSWIQKLDRPIVPAERANFSYNFLVTGTSFELRNKLRRELLFCTKEQIMQAAQKWLEKDWKGAKVCVFGSNKQIIKETSYQPSHPL